MRIGFGYDVHRLVKGRKLFLGCEEIEYEYGLLGHSDADVLIHAIADALLGAAALGDIGMHFPDTDPEYEGISGKSLLEKTYKIISEAGYRVVNADAQIVCQKPKLAPYIPAMRKNIADILGNDISEISVKATTEEKMGFTGDGSGIKAYAVCIIEKARSN